MQIDVLSPHLDDAAFSCGLLLYTLLQSGARIRIVDVCTQSSYAPWLADEGSEWIAQVSAARWREEKAFATLLCCRAGVNTNMVELVDLRWRDAPLRWDVPDEQVLAPYAVPVDEVTKLSHQLRALIGSDLVLAPFALGGHVDHRLVKESALQAFPSEKLLFYEDLPYACRAESTPASAFHRGLFPLQPASAGIKEQYALCYPSQVAPEVAREMERYAAQLGGKERFYGTAEALERLSQALVLEKSVTCR